VAERPGTGTGTRGSRPLCCSRNWWRPLTGTGCLCLPIGGEELCFPVCTRYQIRGDGVAPLPQTAADTLSQSGTAPSTRHWPWSGRPAAVPPTEGARCPRPAKLGAGVCVRRATTNPPWTPELRVLAPHHGSRRSNQQMERGNDAAAVHRGGGRRRSCVHGRRGVKQRCSGAEGATTKIAASDPPVADAGTPH